METKIIIMIPILVILIVLLLLFFQAQNEIYRLNFDLQSCKGTSPGPRYLGDFRLKEFASPENFEALLHCPFAINQATVVVGENEFYLNCQTIQVLSLPGQEIEYPCPEPLEEDLICTEICSKFDLNGVVTSSDASLTRLECYCGKGRCWIDVHDNIVKKCFWNNSLQFNEAQCLEVG